MCSPAFELLLPTMEAQYKKYFHLICPDPLVRADEMKIFS